MPIKLPSFRPRRDAYPPDLWTKCPSCGEMLFNKQLDKVLRVCPSCGHHFRLSAEARIAMLLDHASFAERDAGLESEDPLGFVDQKTYPDRVAAAQLATGMRDAAVWGTGTIDGQPVVVCVMDFGFMGGSMGAVVGEKVARAAEHALASRVPLFVVSASGGARMQEGTFSLMQLVKTVGAIERLRAAGVPFLSLLSDPTTGGVFASFAVLGDVNIAEPNALIGFAGARVSAGTIAQELPPGFQRSEFLFEHGYLDRVIHRSELRSEISALLRYLVAPSVPIAIDRPDGDPLGLPSFRPLSFLSNLAERVLPPESETGDTTNGHGASPAAPEPNRPTPEPSRPAPQTEDTGRG
jgi:acetyl-CoA carboxylase carboxyl transferase subunit beta